MKIRLPRADLLTLELFGVLAIHLAEIVCRFPCNHTDALTFGYRDCIFALALFEFVYSLSKRKFYPIFWIVFLLSFTIPFVEDKFNIMVPYNTWADRGMPDWGHISPP